ncbi:MAG: prephenate dehydrogenase [Solobacterium sp.]|nr:prephenate dehydrogenase [Solobacterium sp.]
MTAKDARISILGLGVLGGSYAQALSAAGYTNLCGIDINEEYVSIALEQGWIQEGSVSAEAVADSELVISCLYPSIFVDWLKTNQDRLTPGSLLTDVTGVKRSVMDEIHTFLRKDVEYIACHPMAGRESKGIHYADAGRFSSANFIIVPTEENTEYAKDTMISLAKDMNFANISFLSPEEHDRMISYLSQLTHVIAVSLMNTNDNTHLVKYTGDSFRDLTRIAKINEEMWPELFLLNRDYLIQDIDSFIVELSRFRDMIASSDVEGMKQKMIQSTERRKLFDVEN